MKEATVIQILWRYSQRFSSDQWISSSGFFDCLNRQFTHAAGPATWGSRHLRWNEFGSCAARIIHYMSGF